MRQGSNVKTFCSRAAASALTHIRLPSQCLATCTASTACLYACHIAKGSMVGPVVDLLISERVFVLRIVQAIPANPYASLHIVMSSLLLHINMTRFGEVQISKHCSPFSIIDST